MNKIKTIIRKEIKSKIKALNKINKQEQSQIVSEKLQNLLEFKKAKSIMLFWSMHDEICTHELVKYVSLKKKILLPVIENNLLVIKKFEGVELMTTDNVFGIGEPIGEILINPQPDLIIIPGLAFDAKCNRLGRGKGYYDQFLSSGNFAVPLIAIAYNEQIISSVPTEPHDIPINVVITANKSYFNQNN